MRNDKVDLGEEAIAKMNASFVSQRQLYRTVEYNIADWSAQRACASHLIRKAHKVIVCDKELSTPFYCCEGVGVHSFIDACKEVVARRRTETVTICTGVTDLHSGHVEILDFCLSNPIVTCMAFSDKIEHPRSIYLAMDAEAQTEIGLVWGWEDKVKKKGAGILTVLYSDSDHDGYKNILGILSKRSANLLAATKEYLSEQYLEKDDKNRLLLGTLTSHRAARQQPTPA